MDRRRRRGGIRGRVKGEGRLVYCGRGWWLNQEYEEGMVKLWKEDNRKGFEEGHKPLVRHEFVCCDL